MRAPHALVLCPLLFYTFKVHATVPCPYIYARDSVRQRTPFGTLFHAPETTGNLFYAPETTRKPKT